MPPPLAPNCKASLVCNSDELLVLLCCLYLLCPVREVGERRHSCTIICCISVYKSLGRCEIANQLSIMPCSQGMIHLYRFYLKVKSVCTSSTCRPMDSSIFSSTRFWWNLCIVTFYQGRVLQLHQREYSGCPPQSETFDNGVRHTYVQLALSPFQSRWNECNLGPIDHGVLIKNGYQELTLNSKQSSHMNHHGLTCF